MRHLLVTYTRVKRSAFRMVADRRVRIEFLQILSDIVENLLQFRIMNIAVFEHVLDQLGLTYNPFDTFPSANFTSFSRRLVIFLLVWTRPFTNLRIGG